jgi:hypothetical protein
MSTKHSKFKLMLLFSLSSFPFFFLFLLDTLDKYPSSSFHMNYIFGSTRQQQQNQWLFHKIRSFSIKNYFNQMCRRKVGQLKLMKTSSRCYLCIRVISEECLFKNTIYNLNVLCNILQEEFQMMRLILK